jgi:hypothetical protein
VSTLMILERGSSRSPSTTSTPVTRAHCRDASLSALECTVPIAGPEGGDNGAMHFGTAWAQRRGIFADHRWPRITAPASVSFNARRVEQSVT